MALQLAQTAKQELPDVTGVTDTLGWVYYKKKLSAQAIAAFEEITRAEPQNAIYYYHLGLAHTQAGDSVRARRALEETLKLQPNSAEATDARKVTRDAALSLLIIQVCLGGEFSREGELHATAWRVAPAAANPRISRDNNAHAS